MKFRFCFLEFCLITAVFSAGAGNYKLVSRYPVPGDGSWDYLTLDSGARRLYVSHGTRVEVLGTDTGEKIGIIPNTRAYTASRWPARMASQQMARAIRRPCSTRKRWRC